MRNDRRTDASAYRIETLPSGLTVALRPMAHVETAAVGLWVQVGGRYEPSAISGISHFLEHLLFKGTHRRSCEQLKQAIEGVGGSLNGFTAEEFTCYMAKVPARYLGRAIAVLSDMALHARFHPRDIRRERDVILEEIRMYEDAPGQYVHDLFNQLMWPNHPLGNLLSGTIDTVRRMRRTELIAYWKRHYHPRNMVVACAGAFEPDRVLAQLRRSVPRTSGGRAGRFRRAPRIRQGPQAHIVQKPTEQTHVCLGTPAIPRTHPARFAQELLHVALGGNMSSRLFREVREKRGLVYEIGTHVKRYHDTGAFVISAGCDPAKLLTTVETIVTELKRIAQAPMPQRELRRAQEFYGGQLLMGLEDTLEHMLWMGEHLMTVGRLSGPRDLLAHMERVSPQQVQQTARRLFTARQLFLTAIGQVSVPASDVLAVLRRI